MCLSACRLLQTAPVLKCLQECFRTEARKPTPYFWAKDNTPKPYAATGARSATSPRGRGQIRSDQGGRRKERGRPGQTYTGACCTSVICMRKRSRTMIPCARWYYGSASLVRAMRHATHNVLYCACVATRKHTMWNVLAFSAFRCQFQFEISTETQSSLNHMPCVSTHLYCATCTYVRLRANALQVKCAFSVGNCFFALRFRQVSPTCPNHPFPKASHPFATAFA